MELHDDILASLACPVCKQALKASPDSEGLDCMQCKLRYPIKDEIPVLLEPEASKID